MIYQFTIVLQLHVSIGYVSFDEPRLNWCKATTN